MKMLNELNVKDYLEICQSFCKDKLKNNEKINIKSYEINSLSEVPCGFLSKHNILSMNFECGNVEHTAEFFVKSSSKELEKYIKEFGVFKKEVGVFREIIPKLIQFSSLKWAPHFYLAKDNVLVFENLQNCSFEMLTNNNGLFDVHHQITAASVLAVMHASSFIYEKNNGPMENQEWFGLLEENVYPTDPKAMKSITHEYAVDTLSEIVARIPKYKESISEVLPKFRNLMLKMSDFVKPSRIFRNVFCHADLWGNNILFKYAIFKNGINLNDRIPVEAILIDFQLARYAPPALDLMVLLTITSNSEHRKKYLGRLCDAYYQHLMHELKNHSIDVETEFPRQQFDESCKFYHLVGLMESCMFSHMTILPASLLTPTLMDPDKSNAFLTKSKTEICLEAFNTDANYCNRMCDMLIELIDEHVLMP